MVIHDIHAPGTGLLPEVKASRLLLGDCRHRLQELPDNSVDCIITDPPYGIGYFSRSRTLLRVRVTNDDAGAYKLLEQALAIAWRKLKDNRHIYIFTTWQAFTPMAAVVKKYFNLKNALVWVKNNCTRGDLRGNYGYQYEMILYAHKGRRLLSGRRDRNILYFDKVPTQAMQHPTEKPVKLLKYLIEKSTAPGEVVLDMFAGVGSVGVAAQETGRRSILIELQNEWVRLAQQRLGLLDVAN
jgi:site-specific DNA-methyltransferase (adenine-specific)